MARYGTVKRIHLRRNKRRLKLFLENVIRDTVTYRGTLKEENRHDQGCIVCPE